MAKTVKIYDKFHFFAEIEDCENCLFYQRKSKYRKRGCNREVCSLEEKRDALVNMRIKRKQG